ncbi:MAG: hypothetical protein MI864_14005, partial [Pseudomonadales bacterium]|nr:hypothetical protein [Pseudomonadales bacterium]
DDDGQELTQLTTGGTPQPIRKTEVKLMQSGWFELFMEPIDIMTSWVTPEGDLRPASQEETTGGGFRPAFIPVEKITEAKLLAGIPKLKANFTTTTDDQEGTAYLAMGVRRNGSQYVEILNDQFTPLPGDAMYEMSLPAIIKQLEPGDVVGVVVQGFTMQYFLDPEGWFSYGEIDGTIELPYVKGTEQLATAH